MKHCKKYLLIMIVPVLTYCPEPYHKIGLSKEMCVLMILDVSKHEQERKETQNQGTLSAYSLCLESEKRDQREKEKREPYRQIK